MQILSIEEIAVVGGACDTPLGDAGLEPCDMGDGEGLQIIVEEVGEMWDEFTDWVGSFFE